MSSVVEVEIGVPLPVMKRRYPYADMEIGDSFLVVDGKLQLVCNYNYRANKKYGRKYIARKEADGIRVWRTA